MPLDYLFPGPTNAETTWESSRRRVYWAAQASALVAVVVGVTGVLALLQRAPPASALDYVARVDFQRSLGEWLATTFVYSTTLSLVLALLAWRASALTVAPVGLVILAIVVPGFSRACCGGGESSVIGVLRSINSSQQAYSSSCGNGGYAQSLEDLMRPVPGGSAFISAQATNKYWYGYTITMIPAPGAAVVTPATATCNQARADLVSGYFVEAHPTVSAPGRRSFATDERGTIYVNRSGALIQPGMDGTEPLQ